MIDIALQKKSLRKEILDKRKALSVEKVALYSKTICDSIAKTSEYKYATDICLYMPIRNEVDVTLLIDRCRQDNKRIWMPKIIVASMDFYSFMDNEHLVKGAYNILEPVSDTRLVPDRYTLVIMPGSVFSKSRDRIGYGGGYYDRYLDKYKQIITIAAAYEFQVVDSILTDEFDKKPDKIITEARVYS